MQSSVPYILYIHSVIRYFIMLFAVIVVCQSLVGMMKKQTFKNSNKLPLLLLMLFCDLQLLFGFVLYYYKLIDTNLLTGGEVMSHTYTRFFGVEHSVAMLVAIICVHIGYATAKKSIADERKFKRIFWCSFIALAIFMAMTPWAAKQVVGRPNIPVLPV